MSIAQRLYQEGLITYMRTDSIRLSDVAIKASREYISSNFRSIFHLNQIFMVIAKMLRLLMRLSDHQERVLQHLKSYLKNIKKIAMNLNFMS